VNTSLKSAKFEFPRSNGAIYGRRPEVFVLKVCGLLGQGSRWRTTTVSLKNYFTQRINTLAPPMSASEYSYAFYAK